MLSLCCYGNTNSVKNSLYIYHWCYIFMSSWKKYDIFINADVLPKCAKIGWTVGSLLKSRKSSFRNSKKFKKKKIEKSFSIGDQKLIFIYWLWSLNCLLLFNKKNFTWRFEDMSLIFSWRKQYLTHSLHSSVKYFYAIRMGIYVR